MLQLFIMIISFCCLNEAGNRPEVLLKAPCFVAVAAAGNVPAFNKKMCFFIVATTTARNGLKVFVLKHLVFTSCDVPIPFLLPAGNRPEVATQLSAPRKC